MKCFPPDLGRNINDHMTEVTHLEHLQWQRALLSVELSFLQSLLPVWGAFKRPEPLREERLGERLKIKHLVSFLFNYQHITKVLTESKFLLVSTAVVGLIVQILTCWRLQCELVLQSPAQRPEPDVQVEEPAVLSPVVLREAGVTQTQPPPHVLQDSHRPVLQRAGGVLQLQNRALHDQIHRVLTPQRLREPDSHLEMSKYYLMGLFVKSNHGCIKKLDN